MVVMYSMFCMCISYPFYKSFGIGNGDIEAAYRKKREEKR